MITKVIRAQQPRPNDNLILTCPDLPRLQEHIGSLLRKSDLYQLLCLMKFISIHTYWPTHACRHLDHVSHVFLYSAGLHETASSSSVARFGNIKIEGREQLEIASIARRVKSLVDR